MADKEVGALTGAAALTGVELVHVVQGGNSRQTTAQDIADLTPPLTGAEVVAAVDTELGGTSWQAAPLTGAEVVAAVDTELGGAEWQAPEEVAAIDADQVAAYTLDIDDANSLQPIAFAAAATVTVPAEASVAFPVRTRVHLWQKGAEQVSVAGDAGVTVHTAATLNLRAQHSVATLIKVGADEWLLCGDLEAA